MWVNFDNIFFVTACNNVFPRWWWGKRRNTINLAQSTFFSNSVIVLFAGHLNWFAGPCRCMNLIWNLQIIGYFVYNTNPQIQESKDWNGWGHMLGWKVINLCQIIAPSLTSSSSRKFMHYRHWWRKYCQSLPTMDDLLSLNKFAMS